MTGYDNRGAKFNLTIVRGSDLAFELTVTDANAAAVNLSAATIAGEIYTTAGVLVDTLTAVVSGAGSNIVTLSLTDTETDLLTGTKYVWTLWVTRGANTAAWLAGDVYMCDGTTGQSGATSGSQALTVDGDLTVSVTVSAIGYASDAADLLTAIKTVDGAGSGLDADLLDGNSSAYFAPLASPTFTGNVVVPDAGAATEALNLRTADARYGVLANDPGGYPYRTSCWYTNATASVSTRVMAAGAAYCVPILIAEASTFDRIAVSVTNGSAGSTRLGIYADSGISTPGALTLDAGVVDTTATGAKELTISQALTAGRYWLVALCETGAPTLRGSLGYSPPIASSTTASILDNAVVAYAATGIAAGGLPASGSTLAAAPSATSVRIGLRFAS